MNNKSINLIIPNAKLVGIDIQNAFGKIPPGLIPVMGKITLKKIFESYNVKMPVYVGIEDNAEEVERYFEFFPDKSVFLIKTKSTRSISDTIAQMIQIYEEIVDNPIVINFADTIVNDINPSLIGTNFISYTITDETERWTLFKKKGEKILEISDKKFQLSADEWLTFIGVWGCKESAQFYEILCQENEKNIREAFYQTIQKYYNSSAKITFQKTEDWIDVGHIDNYHSARVKAINSRFFNQIMVDCDIGNLRKYSSKKKKLRDEINWFISIPKELKYFIPNIYDYSLDFLNPFIEMEFYGYPPLDDCFVYARFDYDTWDKIFRKLFSIIKIASKYTAEDNNLNQDLNEMYMGKTRDRLKAFIQDNKISSITNKMFKINRQQLISISMVLESLEDFMQKFKIYNIKEFQVIHGDFCFSNILYDNTHGIIKLIDPRGRFGRFTIYGDVYYDLAKLSHSVLGLYDFIIFQNYKLLQNSEFNYSLEWNVSDYHEILGKIFKKHVITNGFDIKRIRFIESLLFLSMLPLHNDYPEKQKVMMLRGLKILTDLLE
ncbi:MAG: hypothetical protein ACFFD2_04120 [Promethearchaeota archaeon]